MKQALHLHYLLLKTTKKISITIFLKLRATRRKSLIHQLIFIILWMKLNSLQSLAAIKLFLYFTFGSSSSPSSYSKNYHYRSTNLKGLTEKKHRWYPWPERCVFEQLETLFQYSLLVQKKKNQPTTKKWNREQIILAFFAVYLKLRSKCLTAGTEQDSQKCPCRKLYCHFLLRETNILFLDSPAIT